MRKLGGVKYYRQMLEHARERSPVAKQIELVRSEFSLFSHSFRSGCTSDVSRSRVVGDRRRSTIVGKRPFSVLYAQPTSRVLSKHELHCSFIVVDHESR